MVSANTIVSLSMLSSYGKMRKKENHDSSIVTCETKVEPKIYRGFQSVVKLLGFKSADEKKCEHSNESYSEALSCGTFYYSIHGSSNLY